MSELYIYQNLNRVTIQLVQNLLLTLGVFEQADCSPSSQYQYLARDARSTCSRCTAGRAAHLYAEPLFAQGEFLRVPRDPLLSWMRWGRLDWKIGELLRRNGINGEEFWMFDGDTESFDSVTILHYTNFSISKNCSSPMPYCSLPM